MNPRKFYRFMEAHIVKIIDYIYINAVRHYFGGKKENDKNC